MQQLPSISPLNDLELYVQGAEPLPANRQKTWLLIGQGKYMLDKKLQAAELELQQLINGYDAMPLQVLTKSIESYKNKWLQMQDMRLAFTKFLDGAKDSCMTIEKKYSYKIKGEYDAIHLAIARELELRAEASKKANEVAAKATEIANFKNHFANEYMRIAQRYRAMALDIINTAYTSCLQVQVPINNLEEPIELAIKTLQNNLQADSPTTFTRQHISQEEAAEIFKSIPKLNKTDLFLEMKKKLHEKFEMYANELPIAEEAIKASNLETQSQQAFEAEQMKNEIAINDLTTSAQSYIAPATDFKPVIENEIIDVNNLTEMAVIAILSAFLQHGKQLMPTITVKVLKNFNIGQMAAACDKANIKITNAPYIKVKK